MQKILILYSSYEGQTLKILNRICESIKDPNILIDCHKFSTITSACDLDSYKHILIAGSIRYGKFDRDLRDFVKHNLSFLNSIQAYFVAVNLVARKKNKDTITTNPYTVKFFKNYDFKPKLSQVFAGALYYSKYNLVQKILLKFIMKITGGSTDTTRDIEFTNWQSVDNFALQLKKDLK